MRHADKPTRPVEPYPPGTHERDLPPLPDDESRIMYCYIHRRESDDRDVLFKAVAGDQPGRFRVNLVGYAIVPIEMWRAYEQVVEQQAERDAAKLLRRLGRNWRSRLRAAWAALRT